MSKNTYYNHDPSCASLRFFGGYCSCGALSRSLQKDGESDADNGCRHDCGQVTPHKKPSLNTEAQEVLMEALVEETRKPSGEIDLFRIASALSKAHMNRAKGIDHER